MRGNLLKNINKRLADNIKNTSAKYGVRLNTDTLFLLSTSGSQSSIEKHNQALQALGLNVVYFTFSRKITAPAYANLLKSPIVRGGAVTGQGLKSDLVPFMDKIDELAKSLGAVNTVINQDGKLHGYNTDAFGFAAAIGKHINTSGIIIKKAVIYGNGGVSGVAAQVLKNMGIKTAMAGRNQERVNKKMSELCLTNFAGPYDLAINATPASATPLEQAACLLDTFKDCKMVFDHNMPEKDGQPNFLEKYCSDNKIYFIPGVEMYIPQMIKQWSIFLNEVSDINGKQIIITEKDIIKNWGIKL